MKQVSDENLSILIESLQAYKDDGVIDPWVLSDGTIIEPLEVLKELRDWRQNNNFQEQLHDIGGDR